MKALFLNSSLIWTVGFNFWILMSFQDEEIYFFPIVLFLDLQCQLSSTANAAFCHHSGLSANIFLNLSWRCWDVSSIQQAKKRHQGTLHTTSLFRDLLIGSAHWSGYSPNSLIYLKTIMMAFKKLTELNMLSLFKV